MISKNIIGVMSGTSLDGLDIALCNFSFGKKWSFKIIKAVTFPYPTEWKNRLERAPDASGLELTILNKEYGNYIGVLINDFLKNEKEHVDIIASHGHTVFHQPDKRFTLQIGDGLEIATTTGITTISDFRSLDIALGGQGAPLVPIGDMLLFSEYDYCINIGGFANISFDNKDKRLAYDICPANIILNQIAKQLNFEYDKNGELGKAGKINNELLNKLNSIKYYTLSHPKSLGKEWLDSIFIPVIENTSISLQDKLRTIYEHISFQINQSIKNSNSKVLITGGGAFNQFLIDLIKQKSSNKIIIPNKQIIEYKEALIFAFLGLLKYQDNINCLATVTGASRNSSCGVVYKA